MVQVLRWWPRAGVQNAHLCGLAEGPRYFAAVPQCDTRAIREGPFTGQRGMSDESVAQALRSSARLVVVEAPAGCGKTFQAAEYARWFATTTEEVGKILILTHTHAACDVFRGR